MDGIVHGLIHACKLGDPHLSDNRDGSRKPHCVSADSVSMREMEETSLPFWPLLDGRGGVMEVSLGEPLPKPHFTAGCCC